MKIGSLVRIAAVMSVLLALAATSYAGPNPAREKAYRDCLVPQITALMKEKSARTAAQTKMDSQLVYAAKEKRKEAIAAAAPLIKSGVEIPADGRVRVDIEATVTPALLAKIKELGGTVVSSFPKHKAIRADMPVDKIEPLAALADVSYIRTAARCRTNTGTVDSEGDTTHKAITARSTFGTNGTGVTIGVLSDGVDSLATSQSSGNLGSVTVIPGQAGSGDEGTAMLEIVHDLAPGATLCFATAFNGETSFAQNIHDLHFVYGCNIIVDDVTYFDESPFQDGIIALAVKTVSDDGGLYFSAAGNEGNLDSGTAGTWEGDFLDGGSFTVGGETGRVHDFGSGTLYDTVTSSGTGFVATLFWADPLGASSNDYDLFLTDSSGNVLFSSTNVQNGSQSPFEEIDSGGANVPSGSRMVILKHSGASRFLHLATWRRSLSITTAGNVQGHNSAEATNAFCVAAAPAHNAFTTGYPAGPYPNPFTTSSAFEPFTSDGPRRMFYNPDGTAITPGNFSSTGGQVYQKPDMTAADGVVTSVAGFSPFFGTSAAAPHAAAIAALVKSAKLNATPAQVRAALVNTALDIGASGWDRDSGAGIVMAYEAVQSVSSLTLNVYSTPLNGLAVGSTTGHGGTTNYCLSPVAAGTTVNLSAPATDPPGYAFVKWTLGGTDQTGGQKSLTFSMPAAGTGAIAAYQSLPLTITTTSLPTGYVGSSYSATLAAAGGTAPYTWWMLPPETPTAQVTPAGGTAQGWHADDASWLYTLPFSFPYMGKTYTSVYVCSNGFLDFASSATTYSNSTSGLQTNVRIAPLWDDLKTNGTAQSGEDIYIRQPDGSSVVIRWVAETHSGHHPANFEVLLRSNGEIEFHYGAGNTGLTPTVGLGSGNTAYYVLSAHDSQSSLTNAQTSYFKSPLPAGLTLAASTGAVSGTPTAAGTQNVQFIVNDSAGAQASKTLALQVLLPAGNTLTVQSMPLTGAVIGSATGDGGTTNYQVAGISGGSNVNLSAPASDPTGYTFSQWTVNATAQTAGQKSITFTMSAATTAVAQYALNTYTLTVQSTPPTGLSITSSGAYGGTTNYTAPGVAYGASVNLVAPATDPTGCTFSQWTVNGTAQTAGLKNITFTMTAATTAVAQYALNTYTLTVQSTPPTGVAITSSTGDAGTTNYTVPSVAYGTSVNLVAAATDPTGHTFSQWTVNATAQTAGQKSITFTMPASATTAVAQYALNTYTLTVQSTPPTGVAITSSTGDAGTTNYTVPSVAYGTSVNLVAAATDPTGYTFSQWTVNATAQTAGQKSITFTMSAATTAVAQYTLNTYTLTVQSTPPTGVAITSSTGDAGTTDYTVLSVAYGTSVNLAAAATDPTGYTFSQWTVNGTAQTAGLKNITFTMTAATTAVAQYALNTYTLTVQSTPPTGLSITSSGAYGGTTNYTVPSVAYGTSVNLAAAAMDPTGYAFSQWTVNGTAQTAGLKNITFTMTAATTAAAGYTASSNSAVAVVVSSGIPGGTVTVPINLNAQGNENSLSFSLHWDTTVLTYASSALGADDGGCSLIENETQTGQGELGVLIGQSPGLAFSSGTNQIMLVSFNIKAGWLGTTPIMFDGTLAPEGVSDMNGTLLPASWQGAQVEGGLEGDVNLDGTLSAADWTVIGRIVVGLAPAPTGLAFRAADCAPRATLGNGVIGAAAWTQVGRYVVGLDPQTGIGGPFAPAGVLDLESTPPGTAITSSTGHGGATNCTMSGIASGTSVNLQAPATDPAGYTFLQWVVNGVLQSAGQKSITFTMNAGTLAVAQYTTTAAH